MTEVILTRLLKTGFGPTETGWRNFLHASTAVEVGASFFSGSGETPRSVALVVDVTIRATLWVVTISHSCRRAAVARGVATGARWYQRQSGVFQRQRQCDFRSDTMSDQNEVWKRIRCHNGRLWGDDRWPTRLARGKVNVRSALHGVS